MHSSPQPDLQDKFGEALRELRKEAGLSQSKLSEISGLSVNFISFVERGIEQPSINSFWLLAYGLKIAPDEFVREVMKKKPVPKF